jgi:hypothetical protein
MYVVMICISSDISLAVGLVSWFIANPDRENRNVVKKNLEIH